MTKWIITTATAAALLAGVGAASAQSMNNDGLTKSQHRMMTNRNVSMTPAQKSQWRTGMGSTYDSGAFKAQEVWPQSPPTGS